MTVFTPSTCRVDRRKSSALDPVATTDYSFDDPDEDGASNTAEITILITAETSSSASDAQNSPNSSRCAAQHSRCSVNRHKRPGRHKSSDRHQSYRRRPRNRSSDDENVAFGLCGGAVDSFPDSNAVSSSSGDDDEGSNNIYHNNSKQSPVEDSAVRPTTSGSRLDDFVVNICKFLF